ncbi:hypothetical protein A3A67_00670 [Candidatus Peribacteria bacterium RIFCSPLOWO2_01_FULL_51_18]|nr:MAG: hypothetical protein A3C52_04880 [Candidatus Peribacteria bacterium RIFCSPHIGHO2_02_FULL_51_15]OGJ64974.1 MAG: hypothetical protein A3A67_00670 [Candidatus Peribacteria bacterium RIFCSPLOWO2_01_FULL_51_18]OGJ67452.1 MAG: hypothetical protein A3J34_03850 [Candidatus Peribacteria bacterium RIFCSPLOWO2_02_FULL_51_10]
MYVGVFGLTLFIQKEVEALNHFFLAMDYLTLAISVTGIGGLGYAWTVRREMRIRLLLLVGSCIPLTFLVMGLRALAEHF